MEKNKMDAELLPCPFCGGTAMICDNAGAWCAHCKDCAAEGPWNPDYCADKAASDWNRRSLPVGVPDGWKLVPIDPTDEMRDAGNAYTLNRSILFRSWHAMLSAAPAAPTVKAERVQCADPCGLAPHAQAFNEAPAEALIPSLPTAGSAGEEPTPAMIQAACAAFRMDVSPMQAMQAALRAALSAQQSAPERVSVPVEWREAVKELFDAKQAKDDFERENPGNSTKRWDACLYRIEAAEDALRALLASHAEGGKV